MLRFSSALPQENCIGLFCIKLNTVSYFCRKFTSTVNTVCKTVCFFFPNYKPLGSRSYVSQFRTVLLFITDTVMSGFSGPDIANDRTIQHCG